MYKFLFQVVIMLLLVLGGYWFMADKVLTEEDDYYGFSYGYMAGIRLKHKRAKLFAQPKIVLVGGSNLAYGWDSEMIENAFQVPVVNLGLHGGLGVPFIMQEAKKVINKGDVVFVSMEYFMGKGDYRLIKQTCKEFPEVADLGNLALKQEVELHLNETREGVVNWVEGKKKARPIYFFQIESDRYYFDPRFLFNKYGDHTLHLGKGSRYQKGYDEIKQPYKYWHGIADLNQFKADLEGVDIYYIYPSLAQSNYDAHESAIQKLSKDLVNDLDFETLNQPDDFVFADSLFYDTHFHLTEKGRALRTQKQLQFFMENENVQASLKRAWRKPSVQYN
ncbi:MAG: hypothetical protein AB8E82_11055 [Aureispira sp.]